jgi:c-di-GMP-binding flagellar brake protein YcgR
LLEFDATGCSCWDEERLTFAVKLEGTQRRVQRRTACRVELCSEARYRELANSGREWRTAELRDVSIGGVSLQLHKEAFDVGRELLIEFSLNEIFFSMPSVVRRIEGQTNHTLLYALEYLDPGDRLQDHLAKAISQLQVRIIGSRVRIE